MTIKTAIEIYDTTLRDGTQGQGFNLTSEDKVAIAKRLDAFGVDFIEGGLARLEPQRCALFRADERGTSCSRAVGGLRLDAAQRDQAGG